MRFLALLWGLLAYVAFWAVLAWTVLFLGFNIAPKKYKDQIYTDEGRIRLWATSSSAPELPFAADGEGAGPATTALWVNALLLAAFILPSFLMATVCCSVCSKVVGKPAARSTQVLVSAMLLGVLYWQWLPIPEEIWNRPQNKTVLQYAFWGGWGVALLGTFLIGHFQLTGLRQSLQYFLGKEAAEESAPSGVRSLGRHLVMIGLIVGLFATTRMNLGHAMFSAPVGLYVLLRWAMAGKKPAPAAAPSATPAPAT